jgi:hypothetical protein
MKTGRMLSLLTLLAMLSACASANLEIPENHPANSHAATRPLDLPAPLARMDAPPATDESTPMPAGHHHHGSEPVAPSSQGAAAPAPAVAPSSSAKPQSGETWTCPMHPQIVRSEPGKCPICGMTLVKTSKSHEGAH